MLINLENLVQKYDLKITGVIHVGAHFGQENQVYNNLGIEKRIFFEPLSKSFEVLKNNIGENYSLYQMALGNENKKVSMYVEHANSGQSSSILKPEKHLEQYPHIQFVDSEEVTMSRLDDMGLDLKDYNFIMIDVQGYELEVFKGASNTLNNIDYIMSEINRDELYENCAKINELIDFLKPYGFELVEESWDGGTWGDGFFIKRKL